MKPRIYKDGVMWRVSYPIDTNVFDWFFWKWSHAVDHALKYPVAMVFNVSQVAEIRLRSLCL